MTESTAPQPEVDLSAYVRASAHDAQFVKDCEARARQIVTDRVNGRAVPAAVLSAAILEVGANLYQRRVSAIGTTNYGDPETAGNPMRPALDPITPAWPMLRPYLGPGIA